MKTDIKTYDVHRPDVFSSDRVTVLGRTLLEAVTGLKVSYTRDGGCGYSGSFRPERIEESDSILGGQGGFRIFGTADNQPTELWVYHTLD